MPHDNREHTRRAIWLTQEQRDTLLAAVEAALAESDDETLQAVRGQLNKAHERRRITLRLVQGYNTGLRLPDDAIPVRLTDAEAAAAHQLPIEDEQLRRMINPHQPMRGWRWPQ